jgi:hypothetical protein
MLDNIYMYHAEVAWEKPKLMFRNLGEGKFAKVSEQLGADFMKPTAGRGSAVADFDNDGDLDIAISYSNTYPQLLRNDGGNRIMQFRCKGRYIANVCEGKLKRYPAWTALALPD